MSSSITNVSDQKTMAQETLTAVSYGDSRCLTVGVTRGTCRAADRCGGPGQPGDGPQMALEGRPPGHAHRRERTTPSHDFLEQKRQMSAVPREPWSGRRTTTDSQPLRQRGARNPRPTSRPRGGRVFFTLRKTTRKGQRP